MDSEKRIRRKLNQLSPVKILVSFYLLSVILSTILLSLPIGHKPGVDLAFIDTLFTAVSALSVTGLSSIVVADTFNTIGIIFLAFILQLGAVGVMAIGTFIWLLLGKKIGLRERRLIMADQNQTSFEGMVRLVKGIVAVLFIIELAGFLILGTYFLTYYPTAKEAYFHGFFGMISAISNGGFDIHGDSLYQFKDDYIVQIINMALIIFGAIGFPVLIEVKAYLFSKKKKQYRFTLFTKLTTSTFLILIIIGALSTYLLDINGFFAGKNWHESFFYAMFQSVTMRSGGLSTFDISLLSEANHLFMSLLMFIGASPSSTGGGIRTTTFALVMIFILTYARGGKTIRIFNREVYDDDLLKAVTVTLMALMLIFSSTVLLSVIESHELIEILFEVTSAFGTVGLSLGITSELTIFSKIILMVLMFIGRVGVIAFLFLFHSKKKNGLYHYPKERLIIG